MENTAKMEWVTRTGGMACDVCGCEGQQVTVLMLDGAVESVVCTQPALCADSQALNDHIEGMREEWEAQQRAEAGLGWT